ncbi:hypothetical protein DFH11DRAFT_1501153 [Phellopilus nigrolimitatus]|nr:hypothetical protein DFH11DRAFT_1501153 [Phellopilus nigrolimitatus]
MSNIQRDAAYPVSNRYRRSPPDLNVHGGTFNSGQSGRTVLPPLSSAFANPYSDSQHDSISSRMSPSRNELFSPSLNSGYWSNNGHTTMAGHPPYNNYPPFDYERQPPQASHLSYPALRQSPGIATQDTQRRAPMNIPQSREEPWAADISSYPPSFSLSATMPENNIHSPTSSYPVNYDALHHSNVHPSSYPSFHPPPIDTRHHPHAPHPMHFPQDVHQSSHRSTHMNEWGAPLRTDAHLVSPYARSSRDGHSPQEPSPVDYPQVKKKRKRADAAQLKVLNEVYARTAFPTTEERMELAKKLDMSARSVQIWFQNKRQSTRQSRSVGNALPPIMHHPYTGSSIPSSSAGPSPAPGVGRSGAEIAVSPSTIGGPYGAHSPGHSSHRSHREMSPHPSVPPPPDALRRGRSPEGSGRPKRQSGLPYP